jgi:hypothetical protein
MNAGFLKQMTMTTNEDYLGITSVTLTMGTMLILMFMMKSVQNVLSKQKYMMKKKTQ